MSTDPYYCTQRALDDLHVELDRLTGPVLDEIRQRFGDAQGEETELEENTGYQLALTELGALEARVASLRDLVARAVVQQPSADEVTAGTVVTLTVRGPGDKRGRRERFLVDYALRHDVPDDVAVVSPTSPMGRVLMGRRPKERCSWSAPLGEFVATVVSIEVP